MSERYKVRNVMLYDQGWSFEFCCSEKVEKIFFQANLIMKNLFLTCDVLSCYQLLQIVLTWKWVIYMFILAWKQVNLVILTLGFALKLNYTTANRQLQVPAHLAGPWLGDVDASDRQSPDCLPATFLMNHRQCKTKTQQRGERGVISAQICMPIIPLRGALQKVFWATNYGDGFFRPKALCSIAARSK